MGLVGCWCGALAVFPIQYLSNSRVIYQNSLVFITKFTGIYQISLVIVPVGAAPMGLVGCWCWLALAVLPTHPIFVKFTDNLSKFIGIHHKIHWYLLNITGNSSSGCCPHGTSGVLYGALHSCVAYPSNIYQIHW